MVYWREVDYMIHSMEPGSNVKQESNESYRYIGHEIETEETAGYRGGREGLVGD